MNRCCRISSDEGRSWRSWWWSSIICRRWTIMTIDTRTSICWCWNHRCDRMNVMWRDGRSGCNDSCSFWWVWRMALLFACGNKRRMIKEEKKLNLHNNTMTLYLKNNESALSHFWCSSLWQKQFESYIFICKTPSHSIVFSLIIIIFIYFRKINKKEILVLLLIIWWYQ